MDRTRVSLDSTEPTRAILIGPSDFLSQIDGDKRFLQIAGVVEADTEYVVVLALNKASMMVDPISWSSFTSTLTEWMDKTGARAQIPELTNSLFQERSLPIHKGRLRPRRSTLKPHVYPLFETPSQLGWNSMNNHTLLPQAVVKLTRKFGLFDHTLLLLGILPNQMRTIAKEFKMELMDEFFALFSEAIFWEGYEIWKKRTKLVRTYWKEIAPDDWKVTYKESKSRNKRTLRRNCKNPFHYCEKMLELSGKRRTVCACSDIKRKPVSKSMDIRNFLTRYPEHVSYESKVAKLVSNSIGLQCPPKIVNALMRDDLVRQEHDRSKKEKLGKRHRT